MNGIEKTNNNNTRRDTITHEKKKLNPLRQKKTTVENENMLLCFTQQACHYGSWAMQTLRLDTWYQTNHQNLLLVYFYVFSRMIFACIKNISCNIVLPCTTLNVPESLWAIHGFDCIRYKHFTCITLILIHPYKKEQKKNNVHMQCLYLLITPFYRHTNSYPSTTHSNWNPAIATSRPPPCAHEKVCNRKSIFSEDKN